jgi:hypothetical protein
MCIGGFPIAANSFTYLSDAGMYVAGWYECAVEGREFVLADSEPGGGEFEFVGLV